MLGSIHLVGEDEAADLYADFEDDYNPVYDTEELYEDAGFQEALRTSYGRRATISGRPLAAQAQRPASGLRRASMPESSTGGGRLMTGVADSGQARPMTAVRAAGYTSVQRGTSAPFDPLNQARGPAPPLETKNEDSPEEKTKMAEKQITKLVEDSCCAAEREDQRTALEKAKEAGRKERQLCRQKEQVQMAEQMNTDVTFSVLFNLALSYHSLQLYHEANNTYNVIVKNKLFSNAARMRVNIGNMYFERGMYSQALKFYRMSLDQIPNTHKEVRLRIMRNIGLVFVKMGQYTDAINTYEHVMADKPDVETGFNLLLCVYALGDREKMKKVFQKVALIKVVEDEEKYSATPEDHHSQRILEVIQDDALRRYEKERKASAEKCIMMAVKLIAPVIESTFDEGFDWCISIVKSSVYVELANDLEITRSIVYLKMKDFSKATETLKRFEKRDSKMQSQAAVNLSFLYFLEDDISQADKHAEIAVKADQYNPSALVNKGNTVFKSGDLEKAKDLYLEALRVEATCTEALYNLGLCYKHMGKFEEALDCFHKLHVMLPNSAEVICQLGCCYELAGNITEALDWYQQVLNIVPTDPGVLKKAAWLYEEENDKSQAFQYMYESYRYYPSCIDTIAWLGAYYVDAQFIEKAVTYFERAVQVEPGVVRWRLMLATCFRKCGNYARAMEIYKEITSLFPENVDALKALVKLCTDQGFTLQAKEYSLRMMRLQKMLRQREQRVLSGNRRGSSATGKGKRMPISDEASQLDGNNNVGDSRRSAVVSHAVASVAGANEGTENRITIDASYKDPMGERQVRPMTGNRRGSQRVESFDDFGDDLHEVLLPD